MRGYGGMCTPGPAQHFGTGFVRRHRADDRRTARSCSRRLVSTAVRWCRCSKDATAREQALCGAHSFHRDRIPAAAGARDAGRQASTRQDARRAARSTRVDRVTDPGHREAVAADGSAEGTPVRGHWQLICSGRRVAEHTKGPAITVIAVTAAGRRAAAAVAGPPSTNEPELRALWDALQAQFGESSASRPVSPSPLSPIADRTIPRNVTK